jgi:hypothetical protein
MTDPLRELLTDALGFIHPAFVDASKPTSVMCEFYHQFRKLWDRGIPVGMGLGHLLVKVLDDATLGIHRLGENGKSDEALAVIRFDETRSAAAGYLHIFTVTQNQQRLSLQ